jgi:hypothetical protein
LAAVGEPLPPGRPVAALSRALVISVDGLRPDVLLRADAPALRGLMRRGSFSMWAKTTASAVTLPAHASMLTGVSPSKHGIEWNSDIPLARPVYSRRATLFEIAHEAGYSTAMIAGKSKFSALAKPGTLDWFFVPETTVVSDRVVADTAMSVIERHAPRVLFVHLPGVDGAGHADGWGSDTQLAAVAEADRHVGRLLDALRKRGVLDSTFILVTSDHGGAGTSHGPDDPRSRSIPWIAAGPGVRPNLDLTSEPGIEIRTEDTFATICHLLGLEAPRPVEGRAVSEILTSASPPAASGR